MIQRSFIIKKHFSELENGLIDDESINLIIKFGAMNNFDMTQLDQSIMQLLQKPNPEQSQIKSNFMRICRMPWDSEFARSEQYHQLYNNRLTRLRQRIHLNHQYYPISAVESKLGFINLVGMIKRIEHSRKRAFEKSYSSYYSNIETIYSQNDTLELEDESGRLILEFQGGSTKFRNGYVQPTEIPHGVIVGLYGTHNQKKNVFMVRQIILPTPLPQAPLHPIEEQNHKNVLVMSQPSIQQICELFHAVRSNYYKHLSFVSRIEGIIILGCSDELDAQKFRILDKQLRRIKKTIDVLLMPSGQSLFPEKAYHPILFKQSHKQIGLCSNPQLIRTQCNLQMLLFSGKNLKDLLKNCSYGKCSLDLLQLVCDYQHMNPCTPFSLKCQMTPTDQLIMEQLPHLMISGQCEQFASRVYEKQGKEIKLVTMKRGSSIIVDVGSLEVQEVALVNEGR